MQSPSIPIQRWHRPLGRIGEAHALLLHPDEAPRFESTTARAIPGRGRRLTKRAPPNAPATGFAFVSDDSTVQYCLPIPAAWHFPKGDTVVAARVRDVRGNTSLAREIIVRVGRP